MSLDSFIDQYIKLVSAEILSIRDTLEVKEFSTLAEVNKVQGRLMGLTESLRLLRSIPEDD